MKTNAYQAVRVGDLVVAVFDEAERYSDDPREVSRIATRAVTHMLRRQGPKRGERSIGHPSHRRIATRAQP